MNFPGKRYIWDYGTDTQNISVRPNNIEINLSQGPKCIYKTRNSIYRQHHLYKWDIE